MGIVDFYSMHNNTYKPSTIIIEPSELEYTEFQWKHTGQLELETEQVESAKACTLFQVSTLFLQK